MGSNKHTPTDKVWKGVLIMREELGHFDYSKLKQHEADAIIRATAWAEARRMASEAHELSDATPRQRWAFDREQGRMSPVSGGE